jgi:hypothetical protein
VNVYRDELALAEEERQFSSERAVHHKVRKLQNSALPLTCVKRLPDIQSALPSFVGVSFFLTAMTAIHSPQEMKRIHCEESSEIYKDELRVMHNRCALQLLPCFSVPSSALWGVGSRCDLIPLTRSTTP